MQNQLNKGDFALLAKNYSKSRPDYSPQVVKALSRYIDKPIYEVDFVDVGAGTGIWTRLIYDTGVRSTIAIEPNNEMRNFGIEDSKHKNIQWLSGSAENTGLAENTADWVSMASSFHWAETDIALSEFSRILKPEGLLTLVWNPRLIEVNPLLVEIEAFLKSLLPKMERISSGYSKFTENLTNTLTNHASFDCVLYIEGRHNIQMKPERYLQAWKSVNDIQVQLGPNRFDQFLKFVENIISNEQFINTTYVTRSWSAVNKK